MVIMKSWINHQRGESAFSASSLEEDLPRSAHEKNWKSALESEHASLIKKLGMFCAEIA